MSAALLLAEALATKRPSFRPSFRPSLRPTLVPTSRPTAAPTSAMRATEPPNTQRSATVHPRFETAARMETQSLLAVLRLNADFLSAALHDSASPTALDALEDLRRGIDQLEQRFASSSLRLAGLR